MSTLTDLRAMIAGLPGSSTTVFGTHSSPSILEFDGQAWGTEDCAQVGVEILTLTYVFPDLPGLVPGSSITVTTVVDEVSYTASYIVSRGPRRKGDGLEAVVILENA
jgi:hypothetical protein